RAVDQHHVNRARRLGDVDDRVGQRVDAGHRLVVEGDFLPQRAAYALHDIAFDAFGEAVGVDDLPAIVRDREFARPDFPAAAVDVDLRNHGDARAVALRVGNAAPGYLLAALILLWRGARLPIRLFRRCLDDGDVARVLQVPQPELDRVEADRRRHFV